MWEEIIGIVVSNGVFAAMFVGLLVHQIKDSRAREKRYHEIINTLNLRLKVVEEIKDDIAVIKKRAAQD